MTNKIIMLLLIGIPLVFVPIGEYGDYFYEPKVWALSLLMVIFLYTSFIKRQNIKNTIAFDPINTMLLIYFALLIISVFFARDISLAILGRPYRIEGISTILLYFLVFLAARCATFSDEGLYKKAIITACIVAAYGILQYYGIDPFPRDSIRLEWDRPFSTMGNPNFLGSYLVLMLPLTCHFYIRECKKKYLLAFVLLFWCLFATNTRSVWIGFIVSILVYYTFIFLRAHGFTKLEKKRSILLLLVCVLLLVSFNMQSKNQFSNRFSSIYSDTIEVVNDSEGSDSGGSGRIFIWKKVIQLIKMKPLFGHGIENLHMPFRELCEKENDARFAYLFGTDKAHNEYLHIAVSSGILSLIAYLLFLTNVLKMGVLKMRHTQMALPIFVAIIGYLTQAFFNISVVSVAYVFWAFLGLLAGREQEVNTHVQ